MTKSSPGTPRQSKQKRQQAARPPLDIWIYTHSSFSSNCPTPHLSRGGSQPHGRSKGGRTWSCGGSCHPAAASQHQTEPSVTFPDTLVPIPPSRQAGDRGCKIEPLSVVNQCRGWKRRNRSPSFRTAGPRGLSNKHRLAFFFGCAVWHVSSSFTNQGSNAAVEAWILNHWTAREVPERWLLNQTDLHANPSPAPPQLCTPGQSVISDIFYASLSSCL